MTARIAPWPRPHFRPGGADACVEFLCLAERLLVPEGNPGQYWDWSPYADRPPGLAHGFVTRDDAPDLFEWLTGDFVRPDGHSCPPEQRPARSHWLPASTHLVRVAADVPDPADLGYLQAAWAMVRWYLEAGAHAVFDTKAELWHSREEVARWQGPQRFSLRREIRIESEADFVNTRGMVKFGRPELVYRVTDSTAAAWGKYFFEGIATEMALGRRFEANEEGAFEGTRFRLGPYEPGVNAPDLQLTGEAAVVEVTNASDS